MESITITALSISRWPVWCLNKGGMEDGIVEKILKGEPAESGREKESLSDSVCDGYLEWLPQGSGAEGSGFFARAESGEEFF